MNCGSLWLEFRPKCLPAELTVTWGIYSFIATPRKNIRDSNSRQNLGPGRGCNSHPSPTRAPFVVLNQKIEWPFPWVAMDWVNLPAKRTVSWCHLYLPLWVLVPLSDLEGLFNPASS